MGQATSRSTVQPGCLVPTFGSARGLARKVESNDVSAVIADVQHLPQLLCSTISSGRNTLLHVVARLGSPSMLTAVAQLHSTLQQPAKQEEDEDTHQHSVHSSTVDGKTDNGLQPALQHTAHIKRKHLKVRPLVVLPEMHELVNVCNRRKQTPLIIAASRGHADMVHQLLQLGADPFARDRAGCAALHYAAMHGHADACRHICRHALCLQLSPGSQPYSVSPTSMNSNTASATTSSYTSSSRGTRLSSSGASSITSSSTNSSTNSSTRMTSSVPPVNWDAVTPLSRLLSMACHAGATALHFAADAGHAEVVRLLCAHGADIHAAMEPTQMHCVTLHSGATPLHLAAEQGHLSVALALLKHYQENERGSHRSPNNDPRNAQDRSGLRPHQLAFLTHHFRVALVIRPNYPLSWLFDTSPNRCPTVPSLARLAAAALSVHLHHQLDELQAQGDSTQAVPPRCVTHCQGEAQVASIWAEHKAVPTACSTGCLGAAVALQPVGTQQPAAAARPPPPFPSCSVSPSSPSFSSFPSPSPSSSSSSSYSSSLCARQLLTADDTPTARQPQGVSWQDNACFDLAALHRPEGGGETGVMGDGQLSAPSPGHAGPHQAALAATAPGAGIDTADSITARAGACVTAMPASSGQSGPASSGQSTYIASVSSCSEPCSLDVGCSEPAGWPADMGCGKKDDAVCDVCFEEGSRLVQLQPCSHWLCMPCTRRVCTGITTQPAVCPFCRTPMASFQWA